MKITKRQLRRIIKEEKANLLKESMTDMTDVETVIENAARSVGDIFVKKMYALYQEAPENLGAESNFDLGGDEDTWQDRVNDAVLELDTSVQRAIEEAVQSIESRLVYGDEY